MEMLFFYFLLEQTQTINNKDNPECFTERTLPTSMIIAMIAWQMSTARGTVIGRRKGFDCLNELVARCTKTNGFSLHVSFGNSALLKI